MSVIVPVPSVDLEMRCAVCSSELTASMNRQGDGLVVDPCDKCVTDAKDEGDQEGYERGLEDGRSEEKPT